MTEKIVYLPTFLDNPDNPARCNRATGVIEINQSVMNKLTPLQQRYWLEHERGHIRLQTTDEIEADRYAFQRLAGTEPYSLKQIRQTMNKTIQFSSSVPRLQANAIDSLQFSADQGNAYAKTLITSNNVTKAQSRVINGVKPSLATPQAATFIDSSQTAQSNPIIVENEALPEAIDIDAPQIESLATDEMTTKDDEVFLNIDESTEDTTPPVPMSPTGPQKSISVQVDYTSPKEVIETAAYAAEEEKAKSKSNTIIWGVVVAVVAMIVIVALIFHNKKS